MCYICLCIVKKKENKQKQAGIGPFKKESRRLNSIYKQRERAFELSKTLRKEERDISFLPSIGLELYQLGVQTWQ